jgi:nuclear factor related to kappa-B-binding protein
VSLLCLVRDAVARLPCGLGTRSDVVCLIRDSQYAVESVTDGQVNSVVSGGLDRLHAEKDPCVRYDSDKKLWFYLHKRRKPEDFNCSMLRDIGIGIGYEMTD